jgi:hypothetical protein
LKSTVYAGVAKKNAKIDSQVAKTLPNQGFKVFLGPQKEFRVPGLLSEINTL